MIWRKKRLKELLRQGSEMEAKRQFDQAYKYLSRALKLDENNVKTLFRLASVCAKNGKMPEAIAYLKDLLEIEPDNHKAIKLKEKLDTKSEHVTFSKAAAPKRKGERPDTLRVSKVALLQEANTAKLNGNPDLALSILERAQSQFPNDLQIQFRTAAILSQLDRLDDAVTVLDALLSHSPNYEKALDLKSRLTIQIREKLIRQGFRYLAEWRVPETEEIAGKLSPYGRFHLLMSETEYVRGSVDNAQAHLQKAIEDLPLSYQTFMQIKLILGPENEQSYLENLYPKLGYGSAIEAGEALDLIRILYFSRKFDLALRFIHRMKSSAHAKSKDYFDQLVFWDLRIRQTEGDCTYVVNRTEKAYQDGSISRALAALRAMALMELARYEEAWASFSKSLTRSSARKFNPLRFHLVARLVSVTSAYSLYNTNSTARGLKTAFPSKYTSNFEDLTSAKDPVFIVDGGVGDEIRHASIYNFISKHCKKAIVTCDPRLETMLKRSYPKLRFMPVVRWRTETRIGKYVGRSAVDGDKACAMVCDDRIWERLKQADVICTVAGAISTAFPTDEIFTTPRRPTLRVAPEARRHFRSELHHLRALGKPLVGICWRSSMRSVARDIHYTDIDQWQNILTLPGLTFVNLQTKITDEEREEITRMGGKLHEVEIDLFDDFEGMAGLMKELDLVIAPATTTIELAGALGVPGYLLAPGYETSWRRQPDGRDIWHASLRSFTPSKPGDKVDMLGQLRHALETNQHEMWKTEANASIWTKMARRLVKLFEL